MFLIWRRETSGFKFTMDHYGVELVQQVIRGKGGCDNYRQTGRDLKSRIEGFERTIHMV